MAPFTFTLFAPYNKQAALRLKNANVRMFGVDILMEKDESDGYFRATVDLADGIYHYQFKIQTKSWFEEEPEPALPNYDDEEYKDMTQEEKQEKTQAYTKLIDEIRERNRQREREATFTEIWYTFVDPYATDVDELHKNSIRVILDGVYNHCDCSSPLTQIDHDYWYHHNPKDSIMSWGPEWNYNFYDSKYNIWPARKFIGDSIRYMVEEFHIDGIRFDAARQIQNFDFLHWVVKEAKKAAGVKPFYCVAEFLPDEPCITNIDGPMDGCWHDSFYWTIRDLLLYDNIDIGRLKSVIDCRQQGYLGVTNVVNYIGNHDHDRMLVELGKERSIFGEEAFKRIRLGVVLEMTSIGIPMIWMGEEMGEYKEKTPDVAKIDWSLIADREDNSNNINKNLLGLYRGLVRLRKENKAFFQTNLDFIHEDHDAKVLVYQRWSNSGERVVVIVNLSGHFLAHYRVPNMPVNGWWHEWTFNYDCKVDYNEVHLDLAEREAKILVWLGEDWQPPAPQPEPPTEPAPNNDTNMTKANREENQQY
ncbi:unnamed protein product [Rotaria sp. Silwood1]|nr:unnamed protein product [Rotaria sp. Silwood1]